MAGIGFELKKLFSEEEELPFAKFLPENLPYLVFLFVINGYKQNYILTFSVFRLPKKQNKNHTFIQVIFLQ